jgi:hypothetical protein
MERNGTTLTVTCFWGGIAKIQSRGNEARAEQVFLLPSQVVNVGNQAVLSNSRGTFSYQVQVREQVNRQRASGTHSNCQVPEKVFAP